MKRSLSLVAMISVLSFIGCGGGSEEAGDKAPPSSDAELALVGHWVSVGDSREYFLNADGTAIYQTSTETNQSDNWSVVDGLFYFTSDYGCEYTLNGDTFSIFMGPPGNQSWSEFARR